MTTRDQQREATRAEVLAAAEGLFLNRGFEATTVREIAAAAGVSVGTVMAVGDKAALLAAVFDRGIALVDERRREQARARAASRGRGSDASVGVTAPTPVPTPLDTLEALVAVVEPYVQLFASRIDLARAYGGVLMVGAHGETVFGSLAEELREAFATVLLDGAPTHPAPEWVRRRDARARAGALYLAYMGTLFVWAGSGEERPEAFLATFREAAAAIAELPRAVGEAGRR